MGQLQSVSLAKQLQEDYMAYSMAVLVGRAIPDIYDGLIPSRRRLLQTMLEEGLLPDRKYVKAARATGLTLAYYHPHGSAYGSLISMATPWNNNVPWIDGHGNLGSTVDPPAAERYLECKLRHSAIDILLQDREIWETRGNYDGSRQEAVRFNTALPTVLLNGDSGIAVGFATKLAPHGLQSLVESIKLLSKTTTNEKVRLENIRKAKEILIPDFPTGCRIVRDEQLDQYVKTGSGNIRCLAKVEEGVVKKQGKGRDFPCLTFTNLPPSTNPEKLGEQIKNELDRGRVAGITSINDLSDMTGDRIEIVAKVGTDLQQLKNQLYSYTDLEIKYSAKTLVIDGTKPIELSPVDLVGKWIEWRLKTLTTKFERELGIKEARVHILEGLVKAIDKMDLIIRKIRSAKDKAEAKEFLMGGTLRFTERQAEAILEMKLRQLTNLDHNDLLTELEELRGRIAEIRVLIGDGEEGNLARRSYMVTEVSTLGKKYGSSRKSEIIDLSSVCHGISVEPKSKGVVKQSKPRFLKVDMGKGMVQQVKGPRGAIVVDSKEKMVFMTDDGLLRKVPATFKGAISTGYSAVSLAKRETDVLSRKYLVVFELDSQVKALVMFGEDLCKVTSRGKRWLPDGAKLIHFGEDPYTIKWTSKRKKPVILDLGVKAGKPGGRGVKIAEVDDTLLVN